MAAPEGLADEHFPPQKDPLLGAACAKPEDFLAEDGLANSPSLLPLPGLTIPDLISQYYAVLFRYAFRLSGSAADAEDLTQQTFLVAQQKLHQLREADRAGAWLYAVLRSCFLKSRRKTKPGHLPDSNFDDFEDHATPVLSSLDRELVQAAIHELAEEFRVVVLMFYFEELSYKEIAEQLAIPLGTVMSRLSRAKNHLRERLGGDEDSAAGLPASAQSSASRSSSKFPAPRGKT